MSTGWYWWQDAEVKKEIGLRPDQSNRIDDLYARRIKDMTPVVEEYQKESETLDKMLADRTVSEAQLTVEITKYNSLWVAIRQSRILMLYRISRVLDADQYAKLKAIFDKHEKEMEARRGRGGGTPAPGGSGSR